MADILRSGLRSTLQRILAVPTGDDLWRLQADLLALGGERAEKARDVAGEFYGFLQEVQSKMASRAASRWAAVLETAAVSSVGLQEMMAEKEDPLRRLLSSSVTALLEVAAATKNVEAWEIDASLAYHGVAWFLYGELWEVTAAGRPDLSHAERQTMLDQLLKPVVDPDVEGAAKPIVLVKFFQIALAARMWPVFNGAAQ